MITFRNPDGTDGNCGRPNTFRRKMENVVKTNTMFRIAVKLQAPDVTSLGVRPRDYLTTGSRFTTTTPPGTTVHPIHVPALTPPPAAPPNKLEVNATMDLKNVTNKYIPSPYQVTRYSTLVSTVLHSRGRICGVYTILSLGKSSPRHLTWAQHGPSHLWIAFSNRHLCFSATVRNTHTLFRTVKVVTVTWCCFKSGASHTRSWAKSPHRRSSHNNAKTSPSQNTSIVTSIISNQRRVPVIIILYMSESCSSSVIFTSLGETS
jgi:hypothetical protein